MLRSRGLTVNSLGNLWSQSGRRKGGLRWEGIAEKNIKEDFKPGTKECGGNCIIISVNVSSVTTV